MAISFSMLGTEPTTFGANYLRSAVLVLALALAQVLALTLALVLVLVLVPVPAPAPVLLVLRHTTRTTSYYQY
jgi:hypothetical protein